MSSDGSEKWPRSARSLGTGATSTPGRIPLYRQTYYIAWRKSNACARARQGPGARAMPPAYTISLAYSSPVMPAQFLLIAKSNGEAENRACAVRKPRTRLQAEGNVVGYDIGLTGKIAVLSPLAHTSGAGDSAHLCGSFRA